MSMSVDSTAESRSSGEKETPSMGAVRQRSEASSNSWHIRSRSRSSLVSAYVPHTSADGRVGARAAAARRRAAARQPRDVLRQGRHSRSRPTRCGVLWLWCGASGRRDEATAAFRVEGGWLCYPVAVGV